MRSLIDYDHSMLEVHLMLYIVNYSATEEWRAAGRALTRVSDFPAQPTKFTALEIKERIERTGLPHDRKMVSKAGLAKVHQAMTKLCHNFEEDDLRFDEALGKFWYVPFSKDIEVR